jgi:hypothetical protein
MTEHLIGVYPVGGGGKSGISRKYLQSAITTNRAEKFVAGMKLYLKKKDFGLILP